MRFGIQLYPPCTAPEMAAYAKKAMGQHAFDKVWVPDHLTYENVFVILAAIIGQTDAHVGTSVTHPWARTPLDLASSFATLAHLAGDRGITDGIDEMLRAAKPYDFDIVDMASPLGPNWDEAIDLICQEIIPEIERRSASY